MVVEINHNELKQIVREYYNKKLALFLWGTFGIGKSQEINEIAKGIAEEKKREFVEWNKTTQEEKKNIFENPEKYFVLTDIRLSETDAGDMRLPSFKEDKDIFEWKIPKWAKFTTLNGSDGILFFDEVNLATPLVLSSAYKIIYDRCIDDSKINDDWLIMGAGNLDSDRAFTHTLPSPLRDRGGEVVLKVPNPDDWITNFATVKGMDSRIIGYISWKPSSLQVVKFDDNQKFVTPRSWERTSILIKGVKNWDTITLISKSAMGEGIAQEFVGFCKIQEKLKLDELIKNPERIEKLTEKDVDVKYFIVSAVAEKYSNKKVDFEKIMDISKVFDKIPNGAEFVALLWRLCNSYTIKTKTKQFRKDFLNSKDGKLLEKYGRFI